MVQPGYYLGFEVDATFKELLKILKKRFGNIFVRIHAERRPPTLGVLLGSKFFARVNSEVAVIILLHNHQTSCVLEVIGYAGGSTVTSTTYGAHRAIAEEVAEYLKAKGFSYRVLESGSTR